MKRWVSFICILIFMSGGVFGCKRARTYSEDRARVDQELASGNRGYLQGQAPAIDESKRKKTRRTYTLEVDLPPYSEEVLKKQKQKAIIVEAEPVASGSAPEPVREVGEEAQVKSASASARGFSEYKVGQNDTLQKISLKFYGNNKKWYQIYEANKDKLKDPDKLHPGDILKIPN